MPALPLGRAVCGVGGAHLQPADSCHGSRPSRDCRGSHHQGKHPTGAQRHSPPPCLCILQHAVNHLTTGRAASKQTGCVQTDRQTDRLEDRQTHRQPDRQTDIQTDRQTDTQIQPVCQHCSALQLSSAAALASWLLVCLLKPMSLKLHHTLVTALRVNDPDIMFGEV